MRRNGSITLPNMQYKTLGNTGLLVSKLCFGTMTFGEEEGSSKPSVPLARPGPMN
jgi:hypothetical protein